MSIRQCNQVFLANLPTPLSPMSRLSTSLGGAEVWIKRDDLTGLATGGNKTRKLELLLCDALEQGADTVLTVGAAQSNHCRQTAAAAAHLGLDCVLVLRGRPLARSTWNGNLLLDDLLGAQIVWSGEADPVTALAKTADDQRKAGRHPYVIPYGGSNALGAAAYAQAFQELWEQMEETGLAFDRILFASSSGGTQAGLVVGAKKCAYAGQVVGISVDKPAGRLAEIVSLLLDRVAEQLGLSARFSARDVQVDDRYLGGGYGVVTAAEIEAIRLVARCEGILLDPVYTGKAMVGLLDQVRRGEIGRKETVLFWHTGGLPALFANAGSLL